jgi:N-acetylglucosamine-6-sulfatase
VKQALWGAVVVVVLAASCSSGGSSSSTETTTPPRHGPNIVFVLTDDLSWDLITPQFAPHIVELERLGATFDHYFVADSLCCPSRATIFTGLFPHDTKVTTNLPPDGGFQKFQTQKLDGKTFAVGLHGAGYETSLLGKYLNGYGDPPGKTTSPVPPGWTDWHVSNTTGYAEFNFWQNDNGTFNTYKGQDNYGVDVLNGDAQTFIKKSADKQFAIEVATFAPHAPYTPAPRNANDFPHLRAPRDPSFNTRNTDPPAWLAQHTKLGPGKIAGIDVAFRKRAQAVEAVDKLVADTEATLAAEHLTDDTYFVFSSDNGYHLGQHQLQRGKQTAFETDIRVPLIVTGPGVPAGRLVHQVAQNVDLLPTFLDMANTKPSGPVDGHSLLPLLQPTDDTSPWRTVALVEHNGADQSPNDPDREDKGNPTTYDAIRIAAPHLDGFRKPVEAVWVEYQDKAHETEYYDLNRDPYEQHNIAGQLTSAQRAELHKVLTALVGCHDQSACWTAAHPE